MSYHPLGIYDHLLGEKKGLLNKMLPNINIELPLRQLRICEGDSNKNIF
jgi:hypothetical protein